MADISIVNGIINQLITGGAPPCTSHSKTPYLRRPGCAISPNLIGRHLHRAAALTRAGTAAGGTRLRFAGKELSC